jgi:hypothetical protein
MDYKQASQIRKKSLGTLINENLFQKNKGIGSSVGGAISSKFKAKATGIKESIDPLNLIRKLSGKGAFGDFAVSSAGRVLGRNNAAIEYFGGYAKGKTKKDKKNKKDPLVTTVGAGQVKPLEVGDSVANILAKMYNFMEKTHEIYKLNYEIETAFRQEQMDEDERRHKKLIESITGKKVKPEEKDDKDDEAAAKSFIEKLLEGIKSALGPILATIASMSKMALNLPKILLGPILDTLKPLIGSLVGNILRSLLSPKILGVLIAYAVAEYFKFEKFGEKSDVSLLRSSAEALPGQLEAGGLFEEGKPEKLTASSLVNYKKDVVEDINSGKLKTYSLFIPGTNQRQYLPLNDGEGNYLKGRYARLAQIPSEMEKLQQKNDSESVEKLRSLIDESQNLESDILKIWQSVLDKRFVKPPEEVKSYIDNKLKYPDKGRFEGKIASISDAVETKIKEYNPLSTIDGEIKKIISDQSDKPIPGPEPAIDNKALGLSTSESIVQQNNVKTINKPMTPVINVNGIRMRDSCTQDQVSKSAVPC